MRRYEPTSIGLLPGEKVRLKEIAQEAGYRSISSMIRGELLGVKSEEEKTNQYLAEQNNETTI